MKKVVIYDTAIGTSNLGDEIILQCLEDELAFLLDNSFIMRFSTHLKNLPKARYIYGSQKLDFVNEADYKLIMGTNLLSCDLKKSQAQWPIGDLDSWIFSNCIMAGVGTTYGEGAVTEYSKKLYKRILRKDIIHSVRDEESKQLLESIGVKAINTGCPTLWKFTPEFCKQIPTKKADRVIFSLSGYKSQRHRGLDKALLDILRENYDEVIFWCQTSRDELYLDTFQDVEDIPRIYSLKRYKEILQEGNIDYVGTRLHGGVYALQQKVRSIVISIDHRARGFNETNNLIICERKDIKKKLADMINSEFATEIHIDQEAIDTWKSQFLVEHTIEKSPSYEDYWWVKLARWRRKTYRSTKKYLTKKKDGLKRRLKNLKKKVKGKLNKYKKNTVTFYNKKRYLMTANKKPIEKGKIMFFTFQGDYTCNPKYISEEMFRRNEPWKQVWVTLKDIEKVQDTFPENVKLVKFNTKEFYDELATSQILVDNAFNFVKGALKKKPGQTYVQTMHGSLGLKKIGPEVVDNPERNARGFACGNATDICISNSSFEDMVYRTSFWHDCKIEQLGHARNDIFYIDDEKRLEIKKKVCEYFEIEPDCNLVLYAPTFRNEQEENEYEEIDFAIVKESLEKRFGGTWLVLNRSHHSSIRKAKISKLEFVLNANKYPDIQELMMAIDFAITDYSSWICDYVLRYKPGALYTPDLSNYDANRGFYYPLEETPFPICCTNEKLKTVLEEFDVEKYIVDTDRFLEARGCVDDGHASEKIVNMIENLVNSGE